MREKYSSPVGRLVSGGAVGKQALLEMSEFLYWQDPELRGGKRPATKKPKKDTD